MDPFSSPLILGGILLFLVIVLLVVIRIRSEQSLHETAAPPPSTEDRPSLDELFPEPPDLSGLSRDVISERVAEEGYSSQLQTASDNIRIEAVRNQTRVTVNGVTYDEITAIPDRELRKLTRKLYDKTFSGGLFSHRDNESIRQVNIGNQKTIEARSPDYTVSVQEEGQRHTRYIVNGLTYYSLNDIPDPDMRRKAKELLKKRV